MSVKRLRCLTAVFLAALYGVVGSTGDSLHYLITDGWSLWTSASSAVSGRYCYHVHAPDYHGHFHRYPHDGKHSHHAHSHDDRASHARHVADNGNVTTAISSPAITHEPHACPALTLVSTLKLSQIACGLSLFFLDAVNAPSSELRCIAAIEVARTLGPRGPPSRNLS